VKPQAPPDRKDGDGSTPDSAEPRRPWFSWSHLVWTALGVAALVAIAVLAPSEEADAKKELDYGAFRAQAVAGEVDSVVVHQDSGEIEGRLVDGSEFTSQGPPGGPPDADIRLLDAHGVERNYAAPEPSNPLGGLLLYLLPVILIIGALVWMSRRTTNQLSGATAFTRSHARVNQTERPATTFADIAGYDAVKEEIREVVEYLRDPSAFTAVGAKIPKGILLVGPPGTGKTLFARAVAGEAEVPFISITGSEFLEMFVGVGAARVRDLFATARTETPSIVFVDEIDAIGRKRGTGLGGGHDEREQTLNQLLAEMDGFETTEGIVMLAATNRPDILDPALLRAGRFDRQVVIPLPTAAERAAILAVHSRGKRLAAGVDLDLVARGTPGMSGAELANLVNEAALFAVRRHADEIDAGDLDAARDRVVLGLRRSALVLSPDEKRVVAYHEAGHALLAALLPGADPVHKVTILPTGMALGSTQQLPTEEHQIRRRPELDDALAVCLGGRAAEELVFGVASTGGHDDLVAATDLARHMVREWGMSDRLGHIAWGTPGPIFLGEELIHTRDYSDHTAHVIDEEVTRILDEQAARASTDLRQHEAQLHALAAALLEDETLDAADITAIVGATGARPSARTLGSARSRPAARPRASTGVAPAQATTAIPP
jgi:cell division protease FtsH